MVQAVRDGTEDQDLIDLRIVLIMHVPVNQQGGCPIIIGFAGVPVDVMKSMYVTMQRIRVLEEKVADLVAAKEIVCPCHLYTGQEAVATGVCAALRRHDYIFSTHRSHGHYIAKGGDIRALMAELYGKATGCSKGRGGSMHLASVDIGIIGSSAIVAGSIPLAVGAALAFSITGRDTVAVAFFGDGAVSEGVFYESLNFASLRHLPVIFVCENNLYSTHVPIAENLANTSIYKKAEAFGMPGVRVDGNNVLDVYRVAERAVENARRGNGPTLMECMTYRWRGHVGPNYDLDKGLRSKEELDKWIERCPIHHLEKILFSDNLMTNPEKKKIIADARAEVEEALRFAKESPYPESSREELEKYVFGGRCW